MAPCAWACSRCGTPSSASPATSRCTSPPSSLSAATAGCATTCARRPWCRASSCPHAAPAWMLPTCRLTSPACSMRRASLRSPDGAARGSTTCATHSRSRPCSTGTGPAPTSRPGCRCWPPTLATSTRNPPTGTSAGHPSCCPWPQPAWNMPSERAMSDLAPLLQGFFTGKLMLQRQASPHTVAAYRDTFKLLLGFLAQRTGRPPAQLGITDLDAPAISAFLQHLETSRGNTTVTRNARLAAVHSFFRYAALRAPEHAAIIQRALAIPPKRFDRAIVTFLTGPETDALIAAPDQATWHGRRDHALLLVAVRTGLRVSELTGLTLADVHLGPGPHLRCHGKGRKDRCTPLTSLTAKTLRTWLKEHRGQPAQPRCCRAPRRQARPHSHSHLPITDQQEGHAAHTAALHRDGTPARRHGHLGHRAVARPRIARNHPGLPARRHGDQGTRTRADNPARRHPRPLHRARHPARLPQHALNSQDYAARTDSNTTPDQQPARTTRHNTEVGISGRSPARVHRTQG